MFFIRGKGIVNFNIRVEGSVLQAYFKEGECNLLKNKMLMSFFSEKKILKNK